VGADVRKSREMKKALLGEAKAGKPDGGKSRRGDQKPKAGGKSSAKPDGGATGKRKSKS